MNIVQKQTLICRHFFSVLLTPTVRLGVSQVLLVTSWNNLHQWTKSPWLLLELWDFQVKCHFTCGPRIRDLGLQKEADWHGAEVQNTLQFLLSLELFYVPKYTTTLVTLDIQLARGKPGQSASFSLIISLFCFCTLASVVELLLSKIPIIFI